MKTLRTYEGMGLIYTVGRSAGNYQLFGSEALWWVTVVGGLRSLGLTLAKIEELAASYLAQIGEPVGLRLAGLLEEVRARTTERIAELQALMDRMGAFEVDHQDELAGRTDFREQDPRFMGAGLDSPPGGRSEVAIVTGDMPSQGGNGGS